MALPMRRYASVNRLISFEAWVFHMRLDDAGPSVPEAVS